MDSLKGISFGRYGTQLIKSVSKVCIKSALKASPLSWRDTLVVYFSFEFSPPGFDALWFFMAAEVERKQRNLKHIHVVIYYSSEKFESNTEPTFHWRLYNMVIPFLSFFPSIVSHVVLNSKLKIAWHIGNSKNIYPHHPFSTSKYDLAEIHRFLYAQLPYEIKFIGLKAHRKALGYLEEWEASVVKARKLIVITLRNSPGFPKRNSNMKAWARFAASLSSLEYLTVFVMDTEKSLLSPPRELSDFFFFEAASWNIHIRMALYERAYLNLSINSGPTTFCFLNYQCRFIQFKVIVEKEPRASKELLETYGFVYKQNFSWANVFQKIVWEDDSFEVIQREFWAMCKKIETREGAIK